MPFSSLVLLALLALLSFITTISSRDATGINCRGSAVCYLFPTSCAFRLVAYLQDVRPYQWYRDNELIACCGVVCAFLQHTTGGAWGWQIRKLAPYITEHGCLNCGSVPIGFPFINDCMHGELTFNAVYYLKLRGPDGLVGVRRNDGPHNSTDKDWGLEGLEGIVDG
ncbi:MAG: hypothetical protein M1826_006878 [Phylliscum demangeonii]|nr:MAG: hypothetical protein M1826_006878 [Phylliscum demangeonii]